MKDDDHRVTLEQYLSRRLDEQERAVEVALAAHGRVAESTWAALNQRIDEQRDAVAVAFAVQQKALDTALKAVADTAAIHTEAHNKEHIAHERIHTVEEKQVEEARQTVSQRLNRLNDLRAEVTADRNLLVSREVLDAMIATLIARFESGQNEIESRIDENTKARQAQSEELSGLRGRSVAYSATLAAVFTLMFIALGFYTAVKR